MTYVLVLTILTGRLLAAAAPVWGGGLPQEDARTIGDRLMRDGAIKKVIDGLQQDERYVIDHQIRLCEIPAPPFGERARASAYRQAFEGLGLTNVRIDAAGNVLGDRPGLSPRPHMVLSAHLDTVFPADTRVTPARSGSRLSGPGIADDCRGLAVLLGVVRALNTAKTQTAGSITFVGTVGEEGLGDLRGVKHLLDA